MSGSFINEKSNTSWILNQYRPIDERFVATQSTAFASSSLAATGQNFLAVDRGSQIYNIQKMTEGIPHANIGLYCTDKSSLGVQWYEHLAADKMKFSNLRPKVTVPNIYSLSRDTILK
jgi:hypothetical protein